MPTKYCKECSIKLGFLKKKHQCQKCLSHFCHPCSNSVKDNEEILQNVLQSLAGFNCLPCVVLACGYIRKEFLFLLSRKHLSEFLHGHDISTTGCREKNDLVDLVMEHAKLNNKISQQDLAEEHNHNMHLDRLRENAEQWQEQENHQNSQGVSNRNSENVNGGEMHEGIDIEHDSNNSNSDVHQEDGEINQINSNEINTKESYTSNSYSRNVDDADSSTSTFSRDAGMNNDTPPLSSPTTSQNGMQHSDPTLSPPDITVTEAESQSGNQAQVQTEQSSGTTDSTSERRKWKSMEDINSEGEISQLSVLELKQVLTVNFINFKGCCEKQELIDKVKMLYQSFQKNLQDSKSADNKDNYEKDICKICMDNVIDCVLLDCGHLVSCVKCGKRLNECPICRQLVVRVVHIFRV